MKWILGQLARLTIWRFEPKIIAVSGSVERNSAMEAMQAVLTSGRKNPGSVRISKGEYAGEWKIPLAIVSDKAGDDLRILSQDDSGFAGFLRKIFLWAEVIFSAILKLFAMQRMAYPEILILEYEATRPGEIKNLLEIGRPYTGVITLLGRIPAHVESWDGPEAVFREQASLVEYLPGNGFAVLNFDDEDVLRMKERTRAKVVTFGFGEGADLNLSGFAHRLENNTPRGISFKLSYGGSTVPVVIGNVLGRIESYAAAAAACIGLIFDLNLLEISEALRTCELNSAGIKLVRGIKGANIIDSSVSTSPDSIQEALRALRDLPGNRKLAVLGDILGLGKYSIEAHETLGKIAGQSINYLFTIGPRGKFIAEGARSAGLARSRISSFDTSLEVGIELQNLIRENDLILVGGSKEIGLDKIIEEIKKID